MIDAERVSKSFGRCRAVSRLSFSVPTGSVAGFVGPNGAGKTTTIRIICGAIRCDEGRMSVGGIDTAKESFAARRKVGYLPDSNPLPAELSVRQYLKFRCGLWGVGRSSQASAIDRAIQRCGLGEVAGKLISSLSRGFRQRTGLAGVLVTSPAVVILDEPGSGLDPESALAFRDLVRGLRSHHTVLFSSHNLAEVEAICDHLILLNHGELVAQGRVSDLSRMGAAGSGYLIEATRCDLAELRAIRSVLGVRSESLDDGWTRVTVEVGGDGSGVATALAQSLAASGAMVRRLEAREPSLEDVFTRLVRARGGRDGQQ